MRSQDLPANQRAWLGLVFNHFVEAGTWPKEADLQLELDRRDTDFSVVETANEMPRTLGYLTQDSQPQARATVRGLAQLAEARPLLDKFVKAVELFVAKYLAADRVTKGELANAIGGSDREVRLVFHLLDREGYFLWDGDGPDGEWARSVDRRSREFRKVHTLVEYLDRIEEIDARPSRVALALDRAVGAQARVLDRRAASSPTSSQSSQSIEMATDGYDAFVVHASADKDVVARPLALALHELGLRVWYDEWTVTIGDSLRQKIDEGLRLSRYGVVILSPRFFDRHWPQRELDGLVAKEVRGSKVVLPVWHEVDHDEVAAHSPLLAGRVAGSTDAGITTLAGDLAHAMGREQPPAVSRRARTRSVLRIDYRPRENAFAQQYWADGPHRLFGWGYRVAVTNTSGKTIDGVRLLLKGVREQPYKPMYLRVDGDEPPYSRSLDGVRLDPETSVLFNVVFRNHENREQIHFFYAGDRDPTLRPAGTYTLQLQAQARDVRPVTAKFQCFLEGEELRFRRAT